MKRCLNKHHGFTLIEILIVLVIVAVVTVAATLNFSNVNQARRNQIAIQQFRRVIIAAQQQAILQPAILGLQFTSRGYQFFNYQEGLNDQPGKWVALKSDVLSDDHAFSRGDVIKVVRRGYHQTDLMSDDVKSHIVFLPSGYVTPFQLTLSSGKMIVSLDIASNGVVSLHEE